VQFFLAGKGVNKTVVGEESTFVVECTMKVILVTLAELVLPVNIAAFSPRPHYRNNYFGILNRISERGFGLNEKIFRASPLKGGTSKNINTKSQSLTPVADRFGLVLLEGLISKSTSNDYYRERQKHMQNSRSPVNCTGFIHPSKALILNRFEC
jgi:hypothetical protein